MKRSNRTRLLPIALAWLLLGCSRSPGSSFEVQVTGAVTIASAADGRTVTGDATVTFVRFSGAGSPAQATIESIRGSVDDVELSFTIEDPGPIELWPGEQREVRFRVAGHGPPPVTNGPWDLACVPPDAVPSRTFSMVASYFDSIDGRGSAGAVGDVTALFSDVPAPPAAQVGALWSKRVGAQADRLDFDEQGHVLLVGRDLEGAPSAGESLLTLDAQGKVIKAISLPDPHSHPVVATSGSALVMVSSFRDTLTLGGEEHTAPDGQTGLFVAGLGPAGEVLWASAFTGAEQLYPFHVAIGPSGEISVLGGYYSYQPIDLGGGPLAGDQPRGAFHLSLDATGGYLGARRFDGIWSIQSVVEAPDGTRTLVGTASGVANLGGPPLVTEADNHHFIGRIDAAGIHVWSRLLSPYGVGPRLSGNGASELVLCDGQEVKKLDATGKELWVRPFESFVSDAAIDESGRIWVAGTFSGDTSIGAFPLAGGGNYAHYLAELDADGTVVDAAPFGCTATQGGARLIHRPGVPGVGLLARFMGFAGLDQGMIDTDQRWDVMAALLPP